MEKIACPHCGQDWLQRYRAKGDEKTFWLCADCESVWPEGQDLTDDTDHYLSEFLPRYARDEVWHNIEKV